MQLSDDEDVKLKYLKDFVESWEEYWQPNNDRYNYTMYFVCVSTVSTADEAELNLMARPPMQFNSIEAYGSKIMGEFAEEEPGVEVSADDGVVADEQVALTVECIEAHMRHDLEHANNGNAGYKTMRDLVFGGMGCMECYTDFAYKKSFDLCVPHQRVNPTLCGWDVMAQESHKGDGQGCYKKIYMTKDMVKAKYGDEVANTIQYDAFSDSKFAWAYTSLRQKVACIIEFYWKEERLGKIVKLPKDLVMLPAFMEFGFKEVMDEREYKKLVKSWGLMGPMLPAPKPINKRDETFCDIHRFTFCHNKIIKREDTDYDMLPLIFFEGNSVEVNNSEKGEALRQVCKSMFYNAIDAQRFKDFSGQSFAGRLEMQLNAYAIGAKESFDEQTLGNWLDPARPNLLTYRARDADGQVLPPPQIIQAPDVPQAIIAAFFGSDKVIETTMGFYDDRVANDPNSSGVAIKEAKLQSEAAASPFRDGYLAGLNRLAQFKLNMYPKCFKTPRSIPILLKNGKRGYAIINTDKLPPRSPEADQDLTQNKAVYMNYDPDSLLVKVKAGPSSALQKRQALQEMNSMMALSPQMQGFILGPCLELYLSNYDMRNIEQMKAMAGPWKKQQEANMAQQTQMMQQMQQMQASMQMQAGQIQALVGQAQAQKIVKETQAIDVKMAQEQQKIENKESMDVANMLLDRKKESDDFNIDVGKLVLEEQKNTEAVLLSKQELATEQVDQVLRAVEIDAEQSRHVDTHLLEISKHEHEKDMSEKSLENEKKSALSPVKD